MTTHFEIAKLFAVNLKGKARLWMASSKAKALNAIGSLQHTPQPDPTLRGV
jgi:hypothetical protein